MPRENQRKTENAWKKRNQEAAVNQASAAGRPGDIRFGGSSTDGPTPVTIVGGNSNFFDDLKKSLGVSNTQNPLGGPANMGDQFKTILADQQSITQATKQIAQDIKLAANMVLNFQSQAAKAMGAYATDMKNMRGEERDHMTDMLDMMQKAYQQQQQAAQALQNMAAGVTQPNVPAAPSPNPVVPPPVSPSPPPSGGGAGPTPPLPPRGGGGGAPPPPQPGQPPRPPRTPRPPPYHYQTSLGALHKRMMNNFVQKAGGPQTGMGRFLMGASHGGLMAGLRAAPVVGEAVGVGEIVNRGAEWITDQRAQNAPYQAIYGGQNFSLGGAIGTLGDMIGGKTPTDTSGFSQRMDEEGFVLGQRFSGGMTGDQARQAFSGVSQLGYAGDQRSNALSFVSDNYKQMGMDISQSIQLVQTSAQYGNQALADLSQSLQQVTKAAAATGQSADVLRQNFTTSYSTALSSGMGAGSAGLAQAMTMSTIGTSRDLAGVSYNNMISNPVIAQRIAATGGLTLGQMESRVSQGDIQAFTKPAQSVINQTLTGSMDQNVRNLLSKQVNSSGGYKNVAQSPGSQYSIAQQLMASPDWNVMSAKAALGTLGISTSSLSDAQVAEYYVSTLTSGGLGAQANSQGATLKPLTDLSSASSAAGFLGQLAMKEAKNGPGLLDDVTKLWGGDTATHNSSNLNNVMNAYKDYGKKYNVSNPAIEAAVNTLGTDASTQIRVHTTSGDQVVSMSDAIKYYSDQLSDGSAYVVGGSQSGKRLSDVTGVTIQGYKPGKNGQPDTENKKAIGGVGQSWTDYEKANPNQQQGSAANNGAQQVGTVTVDPSPYLLQLFNFNGTGGVNINGAAAAGTPPTVGGN